jgi:hypothetical protein
MIKNNHFPRQTPPLKPVFHGRLNNITLIFILFSCHLNQFYCSCPRPSRNVAGIKGMGL